MLKVRPVPSSSSEKVARYSGVGEQFQLNGANWNGVKDGGNEKWGTLENKDIPWTPHYTDDDGKKQTK